MAAFRHERHRHDSIRQLGTLYIARGLVVGGGAAVPFAFEVATAGAEVAILIAVSGGIGLAVGAAVIVFGAVELTSGLLDSSTDYEAANRAVDLVAGLSNVGGLAGATIGGAIWGPQGVELGATVGGAVERIYSVGSGVFEKPYDATGRTIDLFGIGADRLQEHIGKSLAKPDQQDR